jgi:hypothetical protein
MKEEGTEENEDEIRDFCVSVSLSKKHEEKETIPVVSIEKRELEEEKEVSEEGLISTEEQEKDPEETEIRENEGEELDRKEKEQKERERESPEEERIKEQSPREEYNEWKMILSIINSPSFIMEALEEEENVLEILTLPFSSLSLEIREREREEVNDEL